MRRFSKWPIRAFGCAALPDALVTARVGLAPDMPPAIALLLPNEGGAQDLLADLGPVQPSGLGLFLADPNLVRARLSRQIARRADCVCNFPSVGQHEHEFRRYLAEVDLDHAHEMRVLADLGAAGLRTIATVSALRDLDGAMRAQVSALLVVPPVPAFAAGNPPLADRVALERAIAEASGGLPVIGMREAAEPAEGLHAALLPPEDFSR